MKNLDYFKIEELFNRRLFGDAKRSLLEKLAKNPNRYIGMFRPTKPYTKLIQNITQSHEIKFGDAFEELIRLNFESQGYKTLNRNYKLEGGEDVNYDQLFEKQGYIIFIEQKVRDDHDSTKKRGQLDNFKKKLTNLKRLGYNNIRSYIYFIDNSLSKNKNYYLNEINKLSLEHQTEINLCYGKELFLKEGIGNSWEDEILDFLLRWKKSLPDFPEVNFDLDPDDSFNEIIQLDILILEKIFKNLDLIRNIFPIIFPNKTTLKKLLTYYNVEHINNPKLKTRVKNLSLLIDKSINLY